MKVVDVVVVECPDSTPSADVHMPHSRDPASALHSPLCSSGERSTVYMSCDQLGHNLNMKQLLHLPANFFCDGLLATLAHFFCTNDDLHLHSQYQGL